MLSQQEVEERIHRLYQRIGGDPAKIQIKPFDPRPSGGVILGAQETASVAMIIRDDGDRASVRLMDINDVPPMDIDSEAASKADQKVIDQLKNFDKPA